MSITDREAGFTLLEVMAVTLIVALVAALVMTTMSGTGRAGLEAVTLKAAALLRHERMGAILGGRAQRVSLDGESRMLMGEGGDVVAIPRDVVVDVVGADAVWSGRLAVVRFDPDGASTGAVLRFSRQQAGYEVRVNWYTGSVEVASAPGR
jgi:general secretion pathway protein H